MADTIDRICSILAEIDMFGSGGEPLPALDVLSKAVGDAAPLLPHVYTASYAQPLSGAMQRLVSLMGSKDPTTLETLTAAVYQHRTGDPLAVPLNQFIAVISDLYRSFLDRD